MAYRILTINPGSTSTKIGFYEDGQQKFETNLTHSAEEIAKYADFLIADGAFLERDYNESKPHMSVLQVANLAKK